MSRIRFEIIPPISRSEEPIRICGNVRALGEWDVARALQMRWEGDRHVGVVEADTGVVLEFKIVRDGSWESEAVDAWGNVPPNQRHDVWLDATVHGVVADWKDRYAGRLTHDRIYSHTLAAWRDLLVWLPPAYAGNPDQRFPVLYFNDGANVFDPVMSPLSGVDLAADEWAHLLAGEHVMPESIVVGVCHPDGFAEGLRSEREIDLSPELGGSAYAQFLAAELVPTMDARYRTVARPEARVLGGTGLGGLSAFYTSLHHPEVFGRMLGLSTIFEDAPHTGCGSLRMLEDLPALPHGRRFYFDYGTEGIDRDCEACHRELAALLETKGWEDGRDFRLLRVIGGNHNEASWRQRLGDALRFVAGNSF